MDTNKAILIGRIGSKPTLKKTSAGTLVADFSLATTRRWKNQAGAKVEATTWHRCVAYGRTAEVIGQYVEKGQMAVVEGRIDNRTWDKPDGTKGYVSEIVVDRFGFGPKAQRREGSDVESATETGQNSQEAAVERLGEPEVSDEVNPEDIPF